MNEENNRKFLRKKVWDDTEATMKVDDPFSSGSRQTITIKGIIGDLSTGGMFLKTQDSVPVSSKAEIIINFDPASSSSDFSLKAHGETVHITENGVGVRFTTIDLEKLQKCIIKRMNKR